MLTVGLNVSAQSRYRRPLELGKFIDYVGLKDRGDSRKAASHTTPLRKESLKTAFFIIV